jgi:hypothetical protein
MDKRKLQRTPEHQAKITEAIRLYNKSHPDRSYLKGKAGVFERTEEYRAKLRLKSTGNKNGVKHGFWGHELFNGHYLMLYRCYNPKSNRYRIYGALGVTVWEPWHCFETFMLGITNLIGSKPEGMSLDRINPWEGYYPWNVRWADAKTQKFNARKKVAEYLSQPGEH